jgi:hypothetical protein
MGKSFCAEVKTYGDEKFYRNQIRFATEAEAMAAAKNLWGRWTEVESYRTAETDDEPNSRWDSSKPWPLCQTEIEPAVARAAE